MIAEGKLVKVYYTLTVEGNVVDSSREGEPFKFRVGSSQVIPGFEKALMGMKVGEKKSFQVSPDEGYGQENPRGIVDASRDKLPPDLNPEIGMTLYARGPDGQTIPVTIIGTKKDIVILNFNHPLAGKTLNFEVEIIEVN
ncbi:MAG: peptidylprolyl isomerase [Nitrospirota bacterium]